MKNQKVSLLQFALRAAAKNIQEDKVYAKSRRCSVKNKSVVKRPDGSYLIPDNMHGKAFANYLSSES